ncbi:sulfatase [Rubritalea tangerina]|uniref:Sulfatase n=1 Tax=Rubritalea tangerina TaxID=430798 RepID=A0ABW4Z7F2_9BACT
MKTKILTYVATAAMGLVANAEQKRPNILFLFSDDHALNAISSYGGPLKDIAPTPHIDSLAQEGALFENSFCANSICGPSRACILTGKHSHKNGFMRNTGKGFDQSQWTVAKALKGAGYTTAVIGKWHLKTHPVAFDYWEVLPGQGSYYNPVFIQMDGSKKRFEGYATDITTDKAINWLEKRDKTKPFFLMCQHKAPHRTFAPALRHLNAFDGVEIPEPRTLFDDYKNRSITLPKNEMEIDRHMWWVYDLKVRQEEMDGQKLPGIMGRPVEYNRMTPLQKKQWDAYYGPLNKKFIADFKAGKLSHEDVVKWKYQRYIRNYLGTVKAVDENIGRMLDYLKVNGLDENTIVIYSSDQGFYLGEHGWYDKRWMFEESFKMPFLIKWPGVIKPGSRPKDLIQNIDYAPTWLEMAGVEVPDDVQGRSIVPLLKGKVDDWRESVYYAYYEIGEHAVPQHYGVRTKTHKLFYLPATQEWQMFDLVKDPEEMVSVYENPEYSKVREELTQEYYRLRAYYEAPSYEEYAPKKKK